jgi:hypothetical protein
MEAKGRAPGLLPSGKGFATIQITNSEEDKIMKHRCESRRDDIGGSERPREPQYAEPAPNPDIAEKHRRRSAAPKLSSIIAITILCIMSVPQAAYPQGLSTDTDPVALELTALDKHGVVIARVREQVLVILQTENACSAWFREAEPDPAGVFRSLHYEVEQDGSTYVLHTIDLEGTNLYKHPWTARSTQNGGRNSVIQLNPSGPFFSTSSPVIDMDPSGGHFSQGTTFHRLSVASFWGNTTRAQITTLLHELGHIVGHLPADDDSWDGRSSRNTDEVLRHCKHEIRDVVETSSRASD